MPSSPLARAARTTRGQHRLRGADGTGQANGRRRAPAETLPPDFLLVVWAGASAGGLAGERVPRGQVEGGTAPPAGWRPHGWEETPDRAPLRMEARPFETISWRDIVEHAAGWLRARIEVAVERVARARIDA